MSHHLFTSESVTEGHPDKLADQISDAVLDALLAVDPRARGAIETLVTKGLVVVTGEIKLPEGYVEIADVARETIINAGYDHGSLEFDGRSCGVMVAINPQSSEISRSVFGHDDPANQGAGDQGMMFGYACDETDALMPMPIHVAHRLAEQMAEARHASTIPYLRPDGKTQVTFAYEDGKPVRLDTILISAQHDDSADITAMLEPDLREHVVAAAVPERFVDHDYKFIVNPSGSFQKGGPVADAGLTGRKIIVDTYGGYARHGGGAFSGKDPSKVDRSGAYAARWVAKNVVACDAAHRCELQVAYAIGKPEPVSVMVETFGSHNVDPAAIEKAVLEVFDLRPGIIIKELDLLRPIYTKTATYGHFGREPDGGFFPWERTDRADDLRNALGL